MPAHAALEAAKQQMEGRVVAPGSSAPAQSTINSGPPGNEFFGDVGIETVQEMLSALELYTLLYIPPAAELRQIR